MKKPFSTVTRRNLLHGGIASTVAALIDSPLLALTPEKPPRHNRIHQSVSRWCYKDIPLDHLCTAAASLGLKGIDLLQLEEFDIPARYGLVCTMGYAGGGEINKALNRLENHAAIEAAFRKNIPIAAKANVPNVITFSGLRTDSTGTLSDEEGTRNCVIGLKSIKQIAEDHGVTVCMELLNSKRDHHDYMCDHTAWGVRVVEEVDSPRIKLLYDIYHMQIMEGDVIATIRQNAKWLGHFHTGGVPGRHELDDTQEVQWPAVMRAIADTGFTGYVAHEFVPTRDPLTSLRQAVELCDI